MSIDMALVIAAADELEKLGEAASSLPWRLEGCSRMEICGGKNFSESVVQEPVQWTEDDLKTVGDKVQENMKLIVTLRNLVPILVAGIRELVRERTPST
jgi:hypothetical protein